jgi:hypothetical protein
MPEPKRYTIWRPMHGTQVYSVEATSKADAKRKVLAGEAEAVDYYVTSAEVGMRIEANDA